ncbi:PAS domain-containing protein [Thermodesulfobacteriota bacterium]
MTDEFLKELLDFSAVATFAITPEHKVIYWNKSCEILTGVKSSDVLGTKNHWKPFYDHFRPCLADLVITGKYNILSELYENFSESTLVEGGLHAEGWYENLGGKRRYIIFDATP